MNNLRKTLSAMAAITLSVISINAIVTAPAAALEASAETVLHEGVWTKKSFKSSGAWSIVEDADGNRFVKLNDDFKTRNAPDLKIFLSPQAAADTTGKNATDGALLISPLNSNKGGQVYEIPAGTDLDTFSSILIHCEQYSKLWSAADLS
ncbi:MAG: DM13 domain-containing protein [Pseudomonadota bacterium]